MRYTEMHGRYTGDAREMVATHTHLIGRVALEQPLDLDVLLAQEPILPTRGEPEPHEEKPERRMMSGNSRNAG